MVPSFGHHIARCSVKLRLQHRPTFLLFSGASNNIPFVWPPTVFNIAERAPTKMTLRYLYPWRYPWFMCCFIVYICLERRCVSVHAAVRRTNKVFNPSERLNTSDLSSSRKGKSIAVRKTVYRPRAIFQGYRIPSRVSFAEKNFCALS